MSRRVRVKIYDACETPKPDELCYEYIDNSSNDDKQGSINHISRNVKKHVDYFFKKAGDKKEMIEDKTSDLSNDILYGVSDIYNRTKYNKNKNNGREIIVNKKE